MKQINLSYNIPIEISESLEETEFVIQGIAINSTITDNQHKFLAEELMSAAETLKNRPLLKDHDNKTESIVGRVINAEFDSTTESIRFKARINQTEQGKKIRELIKSGDLNTVSIGANVSDLDEEDGLMIPRGIRFKELSVVAVPADDDATFTFNGTTFGLALKEAYNKINEKVKNTEESYSTSKEDDINKTEKEEDMEKDETINVMDERLESQDKKLEAHTKVLEEVLAGFKSVKEEMEELSSVFKEFKESDQDEESEEETKEEPKVEEPEKTEESVETEKEEEIDEEEEEESEDDVDEKSKYKIVQGYRSFTIERKY